MITSTLYFYKLQTVYGKIKAHLAKELQSIKDAGLYKEGRIITSPMGTAIKTTLGQEVVNFAQTIT